MIRSIAKGVDEPFLNPPAKRASPSILVLVAALNEEEGIGPTLAELGGVLGHPIMLVVDGKSTDDTIRIAKAAGAHVITQEGSGKGDAIATGLKYASRLDVDYMALIDADFTYPAEYLPAMIETLERNPSVGMISGNRFSGRYSLNSMPLVYNVGNRLIRYMHNFLNGVKLQDPLTGLRVLRWGMLNGWEPTSKGFDIEVELNRYVERKGYGIAEMPIPYRTRLGQKKLRPRHGFTIVKRIFVETL